ncbi:MAG: hypothetical protein ACK56Q_10450 [Pirellulaceae bacterium]
MRIALVQGVEGLGWSDCSYDLFQEVPLGKPSDLVFVDMWGGDPRIRQVVFGRGVCWILSVDRRGGVVLRF